MEDVYSESKNTIGDMKSIFVGRKIADTNSSSGVLSVYSLDLILLFPVSLRARLPLRSGRMKADDSFIRANVTGQMAPLYESQRMSMN